MQPTRYREFTSSETYELYPGRETYQGPSNTVPVKWKRISDVNNGRRRPNSPCISDKVIVTPAYAPFKADSRYVGALNVPAPALADYVRRISSEISNGNLSRCFGHLAKETKKIEGEFSSLNFLYELREVGSLFKDIDGKFRKLSSYRPIDYLFGVAPMISDVQSALKHYDSIAKSTNSRLERFKSYPINRKFIEEGRRQGELSFFVGNGHYQSDNFTVNTRIKGELSCGIPWLAQVDPAVYTLFDILRVNPSAANAYNAIPFSWAFDWLLPLGNWLESLPSLMRPEFKFYGTISTKVVCISDTSTRYSGPAFVFNDGGAGSRFATTCYTRTPYGGSITGLVKWDFMGGINSLSRGLIARDIISQKRRGKYDKLFS